MTDTDYTDVTEVVGEEISSEQLFRMLNRYKWAMDFAQGKDVIEVACGTGPGLGLLANCASSLRCGDYSQTMVDHVTKHYGDRLICTQFNAQKMPFEDRSADVILIFEALYYIPDAKKFVVECKRVLRPNGVVLVSNANSDLFDFNPSPHSHVYHGVLALKELFAAAGFKSEFWGSTPLAAVGLKQKILRPIKKMVVSSGLMPKSMAGKRLLKKLVFGQPVIMPAELTLNMADHETPQPLSDNKKCTDYKVIHCAARLDA